MDARLRMSGMTEGGSVLVGFCAVAAGHRSFAEPQDDNEGGGMSGMTPKEDEFPMTDGGHDGLGVDA